MVMAVLALAAGQDGSDGYFVPDQAAPERPTVGPDAAAVAREALLADLRIAPILAKADFEVLDPRPFTRLGEAVGVAVHVRLAAPIEDEGPWLSVRCQGTRQFEQQIRYTNVTFIRAGILASGEVFAFAPVPPGADAAGRILNPPVADPGGATSATVRDLMSGETLWTSADLRSADPKEVAEAYGCPEGTADD